MINPVIARDPDPGETKLVTNQYPKDWNRCEAPKFAPNTLITITNISRPQEKRKNHSP